MGRLDHVDHDGRDGINRRRLGGRVAVVDELLGPGRTTPQVDRRADAAEHGDDQRRPGEAPEVLLGRPTHDEDEQRRADRPDDPAGRVGHEELAIRHPQRAGQRAREDAEQSDEPPEEHRPDAPALERLLRAGELRGSEVLREPTAEPLEHGPAAAAADRVADRVADDGTDAGGQCDSPDVGDATHGQQ